MVFQIPRWNVWTDIKNYIYQDGPWSPNSHFIPIYDNISSLQNPAVQLFHLSRMQMRNVVYKKVSKILNRLNSSCSLGLLSLTHRKDPWTFFERVSCLLVIPISQFSFYLSSFSHSHTQHIDVRGEIWVTSGNTSKAIRNNNLTSGGQSENTDIRYQKSMAVWVHFVNGQMALQFSGRAIY
jgi:hypothetical protein